MISLNLKYGLELAIGFWYRGLMDIDRCIMYLEFRKVRSLAQILESH